MNPSVYKRPLFVCLLLWIAVLVFFYHPVPGARDVSHFISHEVTIVGKVESFAVSKPKSDNVLVKVFSVNGEKADGFLYTRFSSYQPQWKDVISFSGKVKSPYGTELIGNFNWKKYLSYKGVFAEVKTADASVVKQAPLPVRMIRQVRQDILEVFNTHFPHDLANIAGGILLGERGDLDETLFTAFQDSGAIHLLVASGGNVGFVTLIVLTICSFFGVPRKKSLIISLAVAGIYTLIAGADAPLVRAYFMTVCAVTGYLLGRNSGIFQGLIISAFVILIYRPGALFETGFQMSFLATLAIVFCAGTVTFPKAWPRWVKFFLQIFLVTLAVQLILLPVFTTVFYKISIVGLFANMLLVPLASFLLAVTFAYYIAEVLHVGFLLYFPALWGLKLFHGLVLFFSSFSFSSVAVTSWQTGTIIIYFIGLFALFYLPRKPFFRKIWLPCLLVCILVFSYSRLSRKDLRFYLLDEHGKHTVLAYLRGKTFVVGTGIAPDKIRNALYRTGSSKADVVFSFSSYVPKRELKSFVPVGMTVYPLTEDAWVGDSWSFGDTEVRLEWDGLRKGYSGSSKDRVSYCFSAKEKSFCIRDDGASIQTGTGFLRGQRNKTIFYQI